jgi:tripeptidyl-peptidase-1
MNAADKIPDIISMSWGWSESDQCSITTCNNETAKQYVDRVNTEYVKLGLRGVTITVASGDAGAPGRTNEGCYDNSSTVHAVFPGSSPWVTSVGATFIESPNENVTYNWTTQLCKENSCATGNEQYVTHFNYTGWTAGGGICNFTDRKKKAKWQDDVVKQYLSSNPLPLNFYQ